MAGEGLTPCSGPWFERYYPGGGAPKVVRDACANALRKLSATRTEMAVYRPTSGSGIIPLRTTSAASLTVERDLSRNNAHRLKVAGLGSTSTATRQSKVGDLGGAVGGAIGGDRGQEIGTLIGEGLNALFGPKDRPTAGGQSFAPSGAGGPCPAGSISMGGRCVDPGAILPGGDPFISPGGGSPVQGSFGLMAKTPMVETRIRRSCGRGYVLGIDNLCYPKQLLPRRSKWRKWRAAPKPPVSAADMKAIRRAARAKDRVADLGRDVGLHVSRTRGKSKKQIEQEVRLELLERG